MRKETGWLAAVLVTATLGVGVHSLQITPATSNSGGENAVEGGSKGKLTSPQTPTQELKTYVEPVAGPCADLEEQLQAFFDSDQIAAPASCYSPDEDSTNIGLAGQTGNMHFAIAVVPDPLHTHFSLTFDRYAEAMQQAAQDQGYYYDSSWMPWETEDASYPLLRDKLKAEDQTKQREEQPGIILFRGKESGSGNTDMAYGGGLAIFVVGEEATAGIHRKQFENALAWIAVLQKGGMNDLKIIGPSFSGSLPSLAQMLVSQRRTHQPYSVNVFSGKYYRQPVSVGLCGVPKKPAWERSFGRQRLIPQL